MVGESNVLTLFMELDMGSCMTITGHAFWRIVEILSELPVFTPLDFVPYKSVKALFID